MRNTENTKTCLHCHTSFRQGRVDKKYCDNYCRSAYNNRMKKSLPKLMRAINLSLKHNRMVLDEICSTRRGKVKIHANVLTEKGYDYRYFTHLTYNRSGEESRCCYDYIIRPIGQEYFMITKRLD